MSLVLNGRDVEPSGSLLDTILAAGIDLPHLCKDDNLAPIGACRTCLVEADGRIVASCSVPAEAVSQVDTESERARRLRRGVLALTLGMQRQPDGPGGPHGAETASSAAHEDARPVSPVRSGETVDATSPFFEFHEASCILCGRCVAACQHLQHISAIGMAGRGRSTRVTPGAGTTFLASVCTSCGSCVAACPTPALRPKGAVL